MSSKKPKPTKPATTNLPFELGGHVIANIVCSECGNKFTTAISLGNFAEEVGGKFTDPKCGASFEIISVQKSRITVEVLAKGETRTYGKTYDIATQDYARPL
ncbi:MAG: hypothetical protein OK455_10290 [Thaumarchaeota archaeon]|nr:hypothetical protein [Nitrososphaerota archaeon]